MLQENQQLEQAIQNISHDLRTPLTVASGYTQLLQADATLTPQQLQLLDKVSSNLEKVENHLEQLLTYQRLKDNQLALTLEEFNLSRLLEEELLQLYPSFEENHLSLTVAIQPNIMIISDKKSWQRIFQNVLGNLLEHGSETGTIRLNQQGDRIVFQQENQLRSPIQHPEKLTHRFYTEDLSRHKQQAGLGLYIIAALTNALDGKIQLDTTEETFRLTLFWQQSVESH
jgi:signal transduction histidine kinase